MNINWKKSAIIVIDIALAVYLFLAITVFNEPQDQKAVCTRVDIRITDGMAEGFLGESEIESQLKANKLYPQGQPMSQVNVRAIEESLLLSRKHNAIRRKAVKSSFYSTSVFLSCASKQRMAMTITSTKREM